MDNCRKLNPYSCKACVPGFEEPDIPLYVHPPKDHFQDSFKSLERRRPKLKRTSGRYRCSGEISESIAMTILKGLKYQMSKKPFSGPEEEKEMTFQFGSYEKNGSSKKAGETEAGAANWIKRLFKKDSHSSIQDSRETAGAGNSDKGKAVSQKGENKDKETISASELKNELESGAPILILDVRETSELSGKLEPLENSVNIPVGSLESRISELKEEKEREIVIVCRSGMRAIRAADILSRHGFENVKILKGGIIAWKNIKT